MLVGAGSDMLSALPEAPPAGTVTMLFTDIEGSTKLAHRLTDAWADVLARHHEIVGGAIASAGGHVESAEGDAFVAVFTTADAAIAAARAAQRGLRAETWGGGVGELRVRMGIHTGSVRRTRGQYVGVEIHRAARVGAAAHGGQVIVTDAARAAASAEHAYDDLGSHRLKDFPEPTRLFHLIDGDLGAASFPPPRTLDVRPTNLPATDVALLGRDTEMAAIRAALVTDARLVTVTGLGGAGKTTTALAAARSLIDDFRDGVWLVRSEGFTESGQLLQAIAATLWVRDLPDADLLDAVAHHLADRSILLVLDNLEQVRDAGSLVADLLDGAPSLRILATSRMAMRVAGERTIGLGPLPNDAAAALLSSRAGLGPSDDRLTAAIRVLCERVHRLPLAIELVAPQLRLFSAEEVLRRLDSVLDVESAEAGRPERQRSVRATVDWSLALLPPKARTLFRRLAVFAGPAPIDIIEDVCGGDLEVVAALFDLVDHSLVQREPAGCALPDAVRDAAVAQLAASGEDEGVRRRHAAALAGLAGRVVTVAASTEDEVRAEALGADLLAAVEWSRRPEPALHRRLVTGLARHWAVAGQLRRAFEEIDAALAEEQLTDVDRGELLLARAYVCLIAGQVGEGEALAEEAVSLMRDAPEPTRGRAMIGLAQAQVNAGRAAEARDVAQRAVEIFRAAGEGPLLARALAELSQALLAAGDIEAAGAALDEIDMLVDERYPAIRELAVGCRSDWTLASGDFVGALEANVIALDGGYPGWSVANICAALSQLGEHAAALEVGLIAEEMAREMGADVSALTQVVRDVRTSVALARQALTPEEAAAAERAARELPAGRRLVHVRQVALSHAAMRRARAPGTHVAARSSRSSGSTA